MKNIRLKKDGVIAKLEAEKTSSHPQPSDFGFCSECGQKLTDEDMETNEAICLDCYRPS